MLEHASTFPFQGLLYRSKFFYNLHTFLKLRHHYNLRFKIASTYIQPGEDVLDICSGPGKLKKFLPKNCTVTSIDASTEFLTGVLKKGERYYRMDLHEGLDLGGCQFDVVVMIISLCQFRKSSMHLLLNQFKQHAKKVVIVEDLLTEKGQKLWIKAMRHYVCAVNYCPAFELFTENEFVSAMHEHGYSFKRYNERYAVGYCEIKD